MIKIIGTKIKMISIFFNKKLYPCTIINCNPNKIIYINKTTNIYYTVLLGYDKIKKINKPLSGIFKKYKTNNYKKLIQLNNLTYRYIKDIINDDYIDLNYFKNDKYVDIIGYTIGKGFQGVVKRYNFSGVGGKTHGQHNRLRSPGSIGAGSSPSRVFKGLKMAGHMGNNRITIKKIKVLEIDVKKGIMLVKGSVPGKTNNYLIIKKWKNNVQI
ncbi:MAG: 50S ribosomal protein L3 [Candidatus Shikimatogenerans bostrichidophilus]|nr:MAG: 50S ribosomal protein L3 [Candidatus Shikimatogenerans bostrichidophilus]